MRMREEKVMLDFAAEPTLHILPLKIRASSVNDWDESMSLINQIQLRFA